MARNVKCINCVSLKDAWCEKVIDSPCPDLERDCQHFHQKTNGDRIRAMSDEVLAEFLCAIAFARETPWSDLFAREFCDSCSSIKAIIEETGKEIELCECDFSDGKCPHGDDVVWWLKQPVKEDN